MPRPISIVLLSLFLSINSSAQSASPKAVVDDFVKAWNSHDIKAFHRLFIVDAVWVPVAEVRVEGLNEVVKSFAEIHTTWAKSTTISQSAVKVQRLRPDVAVIFFHLKYLEGGKVVPGIDRAMIIVAVKQSDEWKIAAGQITKQHEGA
jgi:uncharacterized protein (TIGR02246 family)